MHSRSARISNSNVTSRTGRASGRSDSVGSFHSELTPLICRDSLETIPDQFEDIDDNRPNTDENSDTTLFYDTSEKNLKDSSKVLETIYESSKLTEPTASEINIKDSSKDLKTIFESSKLTEPTASEVNQKDSSEQIYECPLFKIRVYKEKRKDSSKKVKTIYESPKLATADFLASTDVSTIFETQKEFEDQRFKDIATNTPSDQLSTDTVASFDNIPYNVEDLLVHFQQKLLIYEAEQQASFYSLITDFFNNKATTPSLVSKTVSILVEMCLEKPFWSEVVASHYNGVVSHKVYGKQCINDLFTALQKIYSEREVYRKENSKKFANSIIMIGQIFLRYRSGGYRRFKFLSEPLCVLLHMLCQSSEAEDMKLLVNQISLNGPGLQSYCREEYEDILLQLRLKIMNTDDDAIRLWSLLGLDVAHYGTLLPKPVKIVYKDCLGEDIFKEMKPPSEAHLYQDVPPHLSQYYTEQN